MPELTEQERKDAKDSKAKEKILSKAQKYKEKKAKKGGAFKVVNFPEVKETGLKGHKTRIRLQKQLTSKYSKDILNGDIISTTGNRPDTSRYAIEIYGAKKWYTNGDMVTQILKGVDLKIEKSKFIVILGPSGSGKTTLLNSISGLDKVTVGDVFSVGHNLTLLKDSHLTKFRRENVGFIFQQYNLLSNLTARENAEVGENLSVPTENSMTIEEIFETIGMKEQMNKYPHQMSGGQQQRVSIARALAKNPEILFGDEPTGALDEEMGRKVLEILLEVKNRFKTTVIIVTHNPNIAEIGDTVIHVRNGLIDKLAHNSNPKKPSEIDWS
ncbi:ABC transporter ATP-binding protein [Spiroplasma tabanidicola]|uniref:ABC transporter ATP-binding protein n=1 Tax=Spiroplasma tabanidicola TaxID=324079 RepID=UPI003CCD09A3